jgi:HAD superfamily hydrolase (TIGR01490 family)
MAEQRIAIFDLDGTLSRRDTFVEFLLFCLRKKPQRLVCLPALIVWLVAHKAGFRSNHWLKARYLRSVAGGLEQGELSVLADQFVDLTLAKNIKHPALQELSRLRSEGYVLVLATASFGFYVYTLAEQLGFDEVLCSEAQFDGQSRLTGNISGKNCIGTEKARRIKLLADERGWGKLELGYSDSRVDLPMLEMVDTALIVDPSRRTAKVANERGYSILNWR